jgi:biotin carboxylase
MGEKQKVAVIGANEFQDPLIRKAKQRGYETHVFAWAAGDVGERSADVFHPISIVEKERILAACRALRPAAVCSIGSDLAAITVNYVAHGLGLPANPARTALVATNKYEMRRAFMAAGVPAPGFFSAAADGDLSPAQALHYPLIVKPTDRSGSRAITKLSSPEGLRAAVAAAAAESFEHRAIVEEYFGGPEYSVECISHAGAHTLLAITEKYTTEAPHFIETGHIEPSGLSDAAAGAVRRAVFAGLDALGVTTGASHSECRVQPDGSVRLIEIGARMGGDCIGSDLVALSTGMDFVGMVLDTALGRTPDFTVHSAPCTAAVRFIFTQADLDHLRLLQRTRPEAIARVSEIHMADPGAIHDSASRFGFYILRCASRSEAKELAQL